MRAGAATADRRPVPSERRDGRLTAEQTVQSLAGAVADCAHRGPEVAVGVELAQETHTFIAAVPASVRSSLGDDLQYHRAVESLAGAMIALKRLLDGAAAPRSRFRDDVRRLTADTAVAAGVLVAAYRAHVEAKATDPAERFAALEPALVFAAGIARVGPTAPGHAAAPTPVIGNRGAPALHAAIAADVADEERAARALLALVALLGTALAAAVMWNAVRAGGAAEQAGLIGLAGTVPLGGLTVFLAHAHGRRTAAALRLKGLLRELDAADDLAAAVGPELAGRLYYDLAQHIHGSYAAEPPVAVAEPAASP